MFSLNGKPHVVVIEKGKAAVTAVQRGLSAGTKTEIVSGVAEGQLVALKKAATIPNDTPIERVEAK